jgi:triosephosphate isomerase
MPETMLIAGNWKMNTDLTSAVQLTKAVVAGWDGGGGVEAAVCPPFTNLDAVFAALHGSPVRLGAQNMHFEEKGAFTGEVSAAMLRSVGCQYVILGHSERRQYFGETDATINRKVQQARAYRLVPIVCVGETLAERQAGQEEAVVRTQLTQALAGVLLEDASELVLAYEPVWAIGTGVNATPEQAQAMHAFARQLLVEQYGETLGGGVRLLYGGSMNAANAATLLQQPDVDGGLVGGASLKAEDFLTILQAARTAVLRKSHLASLS